MALLEHDRTAQVFNQEEDGRSSFKVGLVGVLVGVGLLVGYLLEQLGMQGFVAYASMVLIFGGSGLLTYYRFRRQDREELIV